MTEEHLDEEELDLVLCAEELPPGRALHLAGCAACARRRDAFVAALAGARFADPGVAALTAVREGAVEGWLAGSGTRGSLRWWLAAAAVLLLALLPLLRHGSSPSRPLAQRAFNPDQVLTEVDAMLQQDPLASMAPEDVVDTVVPVGSVSWQGGA